MAARAGIGERGVGADLRQGVLMDTRRGQVWVLVLIAALLTGGATAAQDAAGDHELARGEVRYLCTETTGGYNGVMLGLFATARGHASQKHARFAWADYLPLCS
jgi:putative copper export protein